MVRNPCAGLLDAIDEQPHQLALATFEHAGHLMPAIVIDAILTI